MNVMRGGGKGDRQTEIWEGALCGIGDGDCKDMWIRKLWLPWLQEKSFQAGSATMAVAAVRIWG